MRRNLLLGALAVITATSLFQISRKRPQFTATKGEKSTTGARQRTNKFTSVAKTKRRCRPLGFLVSRGLLDLSPCCSTHTDLYSRSHSLMHEGRCPRECAGPVLPLYIQWQCSTSSFMQGGVRTSIVGFLLLPSTTWVETLPHRGRHAGDFPFFPHSACKPRHKEVVRLNRTALLGGRFLYTLFHRHRQAATRLRLYRKVKSTFQVNNPTSHI